MSQNPKLPFTIRPAKREDVPDLVRLIRGLADYERLTEFCVVEPPALEEHLFGERAYAEAIVAEFAGRVVGFALFFHNYSTFRGKPGIYLEDLYVEPEHRGAGVGKALLKRVIQLAKERDCCRVQWQVLNWNEPAIRFYRSAFGAEPFEGWTMYGVTEEKFERE